MADLVYPSGGMRSRSSQRISTAMLPYASDPLGRRTIGASSIKGPELRQFVFVDDSFNGNAGAVGDAGRATDGVMVNGTNLLATVAPVQNGHAIEIIGAGTVTSKNPSGNLVGWASVSGGTIAIVTTQGGSTPLNASANVTGATVTYGTLDTAAVQAPVDELAQHGGGRIGFSPAKTYLVAHVVPANGTVFTGPATIYLYGTNNGAVGQAADDLFGFIFRPAFGYGGFIANTSASSPVLTGVTKPANNGVDPFNGLWVGLPLSGVEITAGSTVQSWNESAATITMSVNALGASPVGGTTVNRVVGDVTFEKLSFPGHGAEQTTQSPFFLAQISSVRIYDCKFTDQAAGAISTQEIAHLRIENNHLDNVTFGGSGFNAIDVQLGSQSSTNPTTDFSIAFNTVLNPQTRSETIAVVDEVSGGANTLPLDGRIIGNFVQGAIWVETGSGWSGTPEQEVIIANNVCDAWSPVSAMEVINDSAVEDINPLSNSYIVVQGNVLTGGRGLITSGSYMTISGNVINCLNDIGLWCESAAGMINLTATATNGSPTLTSVADTTLAVTLSSGLSTGSPITQLPVTAANTYVASGSGVLVNDGTHSQTFTLSSKASTGDTILHVNSLTPTFAFAMGTNVTGPTVASSYYLTVGAGWQLNNANFTIGTFLLDGVGTTTWTLSSNYTGTTGTQGFTASVPAIGMVVSGNTIHMPQDTGQVTDGLHILSFLTGSVNNNVVVFDAGSNGGATGVGMTMSGCSSTDFRGNRIEHAPTHGIAVSRCSNLTVGGNSIRNASEIVGSQGMKFTNVTGTNLISANQIIDTRASPRTANAIGLNSTNSGFSLIGNQLSGFTGSPLSTLTAVTRMSGNVIDATADWPGPPAVVSAASLPASIVNSSPWPQMVQLSGGSAVVVNFKRFTGGTPVVLSPSAGIGTTTSQSMVMLMPGDQCNLTGTTVPSNITATPMVY